MRLRKDLVDMKLHLSRHLDLCPYCGYDPGRAWTQANFGSTRTTQRSLSLPGEDGAVVCHCSFCARSWVEGYVRRAGGSWPPETIRVDAYDADKGRVFK